MIQAGASAAEARRALARAFRAAGLDHPDLDARVLVASQAGCDPALPTEAAAAPLPAETIRAIQSFAARRLAFEPVARILGEREFHGRSFVLNDACLVPRPDTETVVDLALSLMPDDRDLTVLDLGVGPGTILLSLLAARPRAFGFGLDRAAAAVDAARENARRFGVDDRVRFLVGDWADALAGRFDLVVSNPPYIPSEECRRLDPEVRDHDPRLALDGGGDGLIPYRRTFGRARDLLRPGGRLVLEIGAGQRRAVAGLAAAVGLKVEAVRRDLAGVERAMVVAP